MNRFGYGTRNSTRKLVCKMYVGVTGIFDNPFTIKNEGKMYVSLSAIL